MIAEIYYGVENIVSTYHVHCYIYTCIYTNLEKAFSKKLFMTKNVRLFEIPVFPESSVLYAENWYSVMPFLATIIKPGKS